ncbi:MAG: hypothetical protein COA49_02900 [Bacteroidetes bacterium]|nr:MAG: hypothetical protein COA49_02900 [Bacteroidota bacterium]
MFRLYNYEHLMKFITLLVFICQIPLFCLAQSGAIQGRVTDLETGEPMIGANVYLDELYLGSSVDLSGNYLIEGIPPGIYTLVGSFITYEKKSISNIEIKANEVLVVDFIMETRSTELAEAVVSVKAVKSSENALLSLQKKSFSVQDGISSEEITRVGASNAAESAQKITGTSVIDGKYVYVRGLGDRYTSAQLNGASLISTDPYINSVPLDLIPSNLLDNLITVKTASPDQPGSFAGGIVNLNTKDIPEKMTLTFSNGISYNRQSSFNRNFLSHEGGKYDWLGYDDGSRELPSVLGNEANLSTLSSPIFYIQARRNEEDALLLDEASRSLNSQMEATPKTSLTNYNTSFSFGNQYSLFNNPLGIILGINHNRSYTFYENGRNRAWDITGSAADELFTYYDLKDTKSVENPVLSGMIGATYKLGPNHEIGVLNLYNHDTEKVSRFQSGIIPGIVSGSNNVFETRTLQFRERGLNTTQLKGKHLFKSLRNSELEWVGAYSKSFQDEPDLRFFANENIGDSVYYISVSEYDLPYHYFRFLKDEALEFKLDVTIPLSKESNNLNKIKFGFRTNKKERDFKEYRFYYNSKDGESYQGDQYAFFGPQNTGVIGHDSILDNSIIGNYLVNNTKNSNHYSGFENITAFYLMGMYGITKNLMFSGGGRVEKMVMHVESADTTQTKGDINQFNFFPSINLIYSLNSSTNFRGSFSQTIARPTMRELAPFVTFDFIGGFLYLGNPQLKTTLINNYDIRWEHYIKPGEILAISGYYKHFSSPIVKAYNTEAINPEIIYQNTNDADVYGFEIDVRKNLSFIDPKLKNFKINTNFSYIISRVALDPSEYLMLSEINSEIDSYRPFQGQSPFLLNTILSFYSVKNDFGTNISYNVFGKRLAAIGLKGLPDIYDQPRGMLNLSITKSFKKHLNLKFRINNILNAEYLTLQTFKENTYLNESHKLGSTYSLSLSYTIK